MQATEDRALDHTDDESQSRTRLWDLIHDIRFALLTTRDQDGQLRSRPVTTQNAGVDEDASLWFFMSRSGGPVAELEVDPVVNVGYADPDADCYVTISGSAALVDDLTKKKQLWSKLDQAWFKGGATDPDLALVRVRIARAEYWDVKESKLVQLFQIAKAALTGQASPPDIGEHREIRMG